MDSQRPKLHAGGSGASGIGGIGIEDFLGCRAVDKAVFQFPSPGTESPHIPLFSLATLKGNIVCMVHINAVALVGHIERYALVGNLGSGAAVFVPGVHYLSVFHKRGKTFA